MELFAVDLAHSLRSGVCVREPSIERVVVVKVQRGLLRLRCNHRDIRARLDGDGGAGAQRDEGAGSRDSLSNAPHLRSLAASNHPSCAI